MQVTPRPYRAAQYGEWAGGLALGGCWPGVAAFVSGAGRLASAPRLSSDSPLLSGTR
jgi:hypothetical protein